MAFYSAGLGGEFDSNRLLVIGTVSRGKQDSCQSSVVIERVHKSCISKMLNSERRGGLSCLRGRLVEVRVSKVEGDCHFWGIPDQAFDELIKLEFGN